MSKNIGIFIHPESGNVGIGTSQPRAQLEVFGSVVPSSNLGYDLGSPSLRWRELYLSGNSINLDGTLISRDATSGGIKFQTPSGAPVDSFARTLTASNTGTGPALKVTQTGANSIAEFYDDGNALAVKIADGGNVGIGTATPLAQLHVEGNIFATGVHRVVSIDLSAQTNTTFYPIVLDQAPAMFTHYFSIEMPSQGGGNSYNMHSLHAITRGGGWSDQRQKYEVYHNFYEDGERSILGIYCGTQNFFGTVVYLRGGQVYTFLTNSREVTMYTSAITLGGTNTSTFALKNSLGADVSGTSLNISQQWSGMGIAGKYQSDNLSVQGSVFGSGLVIQCITTQYTGHTTYSSPTGLTPTQVSVLNLTITPKRATSKIILQWMVNAEYHQDNVFLVYRDTTLIGYNTDRGNVQNSGVISAAYDQNEDSTPSNFCINWIDSPATTSAITYSLRVRSSTGASYTLYLNRTVNAAIYEAMCSNGIAWEISA